MKDDNTEIMFKAGGIAFILVILFGLYMDYTFNENVKNFDRTYTNSKQCDMVVNQVLYNKDWDTNVLKKVQDDTSISSRRFTDLTLQREDLLQKQINLVYECEVGDKPSRVTMFLSGKKVTTKYSFLLNANDYNHHFLELNKKYEEIKAELDRKAEVAESIA